MKNLLEENVHLALTYSLYSAAQIATVLFDKWYCKNRLMMQIVSDQDLLFVVEIWKELYKLTGVKLKMSTLYYPKTDGSSKRTNKMLVQAIRYHINWDQKS